ncbi:hypothetical protein [Phaffia rhodozyma]|uniref:Uncharacterized protein n=1 Tax=Phaffia rhodozyma TaxID=264483 RepID=A0A0F7SGP6_PHARH|nr:hypothetical protein [Phaffia rhodozyma]
MSFVLIQASSVSLLGKKIPHLFHLCWLVHSLSTCFLSIYHLSFRSSVAFQSCILRCMFLRTQIKLQFSNSKSKRTSNTGARRKENCLSNSLSMPVCSVRFFLSFPPLPLLPPFPSRLVSPAIVIDHSISCIIDAHMNLKNP